MHNSVHFLIDKYDKLAVITFHRNIIRYYFERDNIKFENENKENFNELRKKVSRVFHFYPSKKTFRETCGPPSSNSAEKSSRRDEGDEFYFIASMGEQQASGSSGWNMFRIIIEG